MELRYEYKAFVHLTVTSDIFILTTLVNFNSHGFPNCHLKQLKKDYPIMQHRNEKLLCTCHTVGKKIRE